MAHFGSSLNISKNFVIWKIFSYIFCLVADDEPDCNGVQCKFGSECVDNQRCACPSCDEAEYEPVCGSDGNSYDNSCKLKLISCEKKMPLQIVSPGECSKYWMLAHAHSNNSLFIKNLKKEKPFKCFRSTGTLEKCKQSVNCWHLVDSILKKQKESKIFAKSNSGAHFWRLFVLYVIFIGASKQPDTLAPVDRAFIESNHGWVEYSYRCFSHIDSARNIPSMGDTIDCCVSVILWLWLHELFVRIFNQNSSGIWLEH